jgi:hypothetical protein
MKEFRWISIVLAISVLSSAGMAQQTTSPYAPLLKKSILAPPADGNWQTVLQEAKIDTTTPAMIYVALNHPDYWTRVAALHVLGDRSSDPDARSAVLQILNGTNKRLATWAGEILAQKGLERARVKAAMTPLITDGMQSVETQMPALTRSTIQTLQQQQEMEAARDRVVNGLWAARVLALQKDSSGYAFLIKAANITNQSVYMPVEVLVTVVRSYADAGLPYNSELINPIEALANNQTKVTAIRQMASQLVARLRQRPQTE